MKYKMPGADASQFTRLKKALAVQNATDPSDSKSVNRLTQFVPRLSGANDRALNGSINAFLPSLTLKDFRPKVQALRNVKIRASGTGINIITSADLDRGYFILYFVQGREVVIINESGSTICVNGITLINGERFDSGFIAPETDSGEVPITLGECPTDVNITQTDVNNGFIELEGDTRYMFINSTDNQICLISIGVTLSTNESYSYRTDGLTGDVVNFPISSGNC